MKIVGENCDSILIDVSRKLVDLSSFNRVTLKREISIEPSRKRWLLIQRSRKSENRTKTDLFLRGFQEIIGKVIFIDLSLTITSRMR